MELIQSIVLRITIDKNNHSARAPRLRYITANDGTRIARMTRMRADQIILVPLKRRCQMLYSEITDKIINSFYKVYNVLSFSFLEKVYENERKEISEIETSNP